MKKEKISENKEKIKYYHSLNHTPKEIVELSGVCYVTTLKYLKEFNLSLEGSGGKNRIIDFNPFIENDPLSDYWLGMLGADGNLSKRGNSIQFTQKDAQVLSAYNQFFKNRLALYTGKRIAPVYTFCNREIYTYLREQGLHPAKSYTLKFKRMNPNILLGLFDGDGCAIKQVKITTASKPLITQIVKFLESYDIFAYIKQKGNAFDIIICNSNIKDFYWLLYKDAPFYMERKRQNFGHLSRKIRLKIGDELLEA